LGRRNGQPTWRVLTLPELFSRNGGELMSRLVAGGENCARDSLQMRLRQRQAAAAVVVGKMMRWQMR
jgi:hypothetical protein